MSQRLKAVYCEGAFLPQEPFEVARGSRVKGSCEVGFWFMEGGLLCFEQSK